MNSTIEDFQRVCLRAEFSAEEMIQLLGLPHLEDLGKHDRPRKDREEDQQDNDDLYFWGGVSPNIANLRSLRRCSGSSQHVKGNIHPNPLRQHKALPSRGNVEQ